MADAAIEAVLRRDRVIVAAALVMLTALAWAYVWWLGSDMDMGGMDTAARIQARLRCAEPCQFRPAVPATRANLR